MRRGLWLWALIIVALVIGLPAIGQRAALERAHRTVEVVIDQERLEALSGQTGAPIPEILARWRELGVTGLAVADPGGAALAVEAGLRIVPRDDEVARLALASGWETGPAVFAGDRVPGYPDNLEATARLLRDLESPLGLIEFASQHGAAELARLTDFQVVRVHSITMQELARLSDGDAAARFARAARERNARVLYIRPLVRGPAEEMLARNEAYLRDIVARLREDGLTPGPVEAPPFWRTSALVPVAAAAAAAAGAVLLAVRLFPLPGWLAAGSVLAAGGIVYVLARMGQTILARQLAALAVALVFPSLAVVSATDRLPSAPGLGGWLRAVVRFVAVTGAGALLVAAALGDTRFMVQLEQFRGVKLAHVAPLAVVALCWIADQYRGSWTSWLFAPLRVWHVLVGAVVLLFGYVYVARTGNDMLAVPQLEQLLRVGLEDALAVRPRTKEFLLGYPAALLGFALWANGRRALAWPLLVIGTVASISMTNTFAHAHAPLGVSLMRSFYGLAAGAVVAALVATVTALFLRLPPVRRLGAPGAHPVSAPPVGGSAGPASGTARGASR